MTDSRESTDRAERRPPMMKRIRVAMNERVVVLRDGIPVGALEPGLHRARGWAQTMYFDTDVLTFDARAEVRAVMPAEWFRTVVLEAHERAVIVRDGRPQRFLRPGVHRVWSVDPGVELRTFDVREAVPPLTQELVALIPLGELVATTVQEHERGLLHVQGRFERVLEPGRHTMWSTTERPVTVRTVDMRRRQLAVAGQELMTRDKVTLRLTLAADWAPLDPATSAHLVSDPEAALYTLVQLAVREFVAGVTLDELLEGRDAMAKFLLERSVAEAERFGVRIETVGVKDIVLPGEMKALLNGVIEAEKAAAANVILRREEAAETRAKANAARLMEERPAMLRLKELEAMQGIAAQIGEIRVLVGADGLEKLLPTRRE